MAERWESASGKVEVNNASIVSPSWKAIWSIPGAQSLITLRIQALAYPTECRTAAMREYQCADVVPCMVIVND